MSPPFKFVAEILHFYKYFCLKIILIDIAKPLHIFIFMVTGHLYCLTPSLQKKQKKRWPYAYL